MSEKPDRTLNFQDSRRIEDCGLSQRTLHLIKRLGVKNVGQLRKLSKAKIRPHRWCGQRTIPELEAFLGQSLPE